MKGATIWVINGPNLNLLGEREPEIYGRETLTDVEKKIGEIAEENQVNLEFFQENEEGKEHRKLIWRQGGHSGIGILRDKCEYLGH